MVKTSINPIQKGNLMMKRKLKFLVTLLCLLSVLHLQIQGVEFDLTSEPISTFTLSAASQVTKMASLSQPSLLFSGKKAVATVAAALFMILLNPTPLFAQVAPLASNPPKPAFLSRQIWLFVPLAFFIIALIILRLKQVEIVKEFPKKVFPKLTGLENSLYSFSDENDSNTTVESDLIKRRPRGAARQTFMATRIGPFFVQDNWIEEPAGIKVWLSDLTKERGKGEAWITGNFLILANPLGETPLGKKYEAYFIKPGSPSEWRKSESPFIMMETEGEVLWVPMDIEKDRTVKAWDPREKKYVTIKLFHDLDASFALNSEDLAILKEEIPILLKASANSKHLVRIQRIGIQPVPYYVVNRPGAAMEESLRMIRMFSWTDALDHALQIAHALHELHHQGIVHGSVSPANIQLFKTYGKYWVRLCYWGRALKNLDKEKPPCWAPENYWAPEQFTGEKMDARTDVYALGALLFHMVVGSPPYEGKTAQEIFEKMQNKERIPFKNDSLENHPGLVKIIEKALALNKEDRFQTIAEMAQALTAFKEKRPVTYTIPYLIYLLRHRSGKSWQPKFKEPSGMVLPSSLLFETAI